MNALAPSPSARRTARVVALLLLLLASTGACGGEADSTPATATSQGATVTVTPVATIPAATLVNPTPTTQNTAENAVEPPSTPETATATLAPAAIQSDIDGLIAGVGGLTAVEVEEPDGTSIASWNAGEQMEAASLYKLAIMVEAYRQRDVGLLTFDDDVILQDYHFSEGADVFIEEEVGSVVTVAALLDAMITVSSNVAATALLELVGTDNVNETMTSLGLTSTEIRWYPGPVGETGGQSPRRGLLTVRPDLRADEALNVTSAADIAALFRMLLAGEVVSAEASQEMLDLLAGQQINDRLPAYLPDGTVVAHKTGNLDGLMHDAGVIYAPGGPVIVVVMTEDLDDVTSTDLIAQIGLLAYESHQ